MSKDSKTCLNTTLYLHSVADIIGFMLQLRPEQIGELMWHASLKYVLWAL